MIVAFSGESNEGTLSLVRELRDRSMQIDIVPRLFEAVGPNAGIHSIEGLPLMGLPSVRITRTSRWFKRSVDLVVASVMLLVSAPLFAYIAYKVKRSSPGPVFFKQERLGLERRPFKMLKFRTMYVGTDESVHRDYIRDTMHASASPTSNGLYKLSQSDSVTTFGRWLRKTSLDELPQLVNVLRGDMSLVGPRPCLTYETEFFDEYHFERFQVPQGITGLWQVEGRALDDPERGFRPRRRLRQGLVATPRSVTPPSHHHPDRSPRSRGLMDRLMNGNGSFVEPLRVAVVGLGYWGPNLARNLQELPEADLVAVCDRDEHALAKLARRYPALRRETDLQAVLDDASIEAVALATPVGTHYPLALRALEAGKHVFVEKPLAGSSAEALHLVEVAGERGLALVPGHTFLYSPSVNLIREQIQLGTIGDAAFPLDEPGQPRPAPERRQRGLGPRFARLLDPPLLARREPGRACRRSAGAA